MNGSSDKPSVLNRWQNIQKRVSGVCDREVKIVGVTKFQSIDKVKEAIQCGLRSLACNYLQEGQNLKEALNLPDLDWHFIGHIQSRKTKFLWEYDLIQSIDRVEIAELLEEAYRQQGKKQDILVQVNIGAEKTKSGVLASRLQTFCEQISPLSHLRITGLMCLPPPLFPVEQRRPFFRSMRELYLSLNESFALQWLSMGTSDDYSVALEEGSNMIRLGACLFGDRPTVSSSISP